MIDRERMDFILQHIVLDENRQIAGVLIGRAWL